MSCFMICVPAPDAIAGRLGLGVEEILAMRTGECMQVTLSMSLTRASAPVILVFTKFDLVTSQVLLDMAGGDSQHYDRARARAHVLFEDACRRILHKHPRDVPAEVVSGIYSFPFRYNLWGSRSTNVPVILTETKIRRSHRQSNRGDR